MGPLLMYCLLQCHKIILHIIYIIHTSTARGPGMGFTGGLKVLAILHVSLLVTILAVDNWKFVYRKTNSS